jgi:DNA-binding NarL/FixJ family response regulator
MIRVLIADDHALIRQGLIRILTRHGDIQVVGEAANAAELLEQFQKHPCDVVVLDITMPGRSGLDALADLKYRRRDLPVLILSVHPEDQFALRALRAGAAGYLTKDAAPEELVNAVRRIATGARYMSADLAQKLALSLVENAERPAHERLSAREHEVMRLLASGRTVSEVARDLSLSVKTVSTYRTRLLDKLGLESTAALMRYALQHGLVE